MTIRLSETMRRLRPSATVSITRRALELREAGHDVIALSAGEPDFATPEHIRRAAIAAIEGGATKYTAVDGTRQLREAIAGKLARENGLQFDTEQIVVTSGAKQACFNTCQVLLQPGDEALIPSPYWVSYPDMVSLAGATPVIVPTLAEEDFALSAERLATAITPNSRLLILNSPNNPTGAVLSHKALEDIAAVLREHPQICVLSDDIYEHVRWNAEPFANLAMIAPDLADRVITINGLSKSHAMSGWRIGYAAGDAAVIAAMVKLQSQSTTNACSVSQAAACAALNGDQSFLRTLGESFHRRHDKVFAGFAAMPGVQCTPGQGAFYLLPQITGAMTAGGFANDVDFCTALLERQQLALVPGSAFGAPGHLRISFAAADDVLDEAMRRLHAFVTELHAADAGDGAR